MKTDKVETFGTVTLSTREVGLLIVSCQESQHQSMNDPEYKSLENEFKNLLKRMTGKEFGVR